ncbi:MAG: hypothetical protein GY821_11245 [Gammaproteobacteria bacterium]|nr:hypothetical protein [Gammaproteobacteria bacterium]
MREQYKKKIKKWAAAYEPGKMARKTGENSGYVIASSELSWAAQSVCKHADGYYIGSSDSSLGWMVDDWYVT